MDSDEMEAVDTRDGGPLPMKFFSTWEVRKVPANCVSRSCSLTITKLQLLQSIEPGLQSVVLSVSMKTPHRSLRSNELEVPLNGIMNTLLNLTFTLEYPHFLKRGGNDLQIRLQRKKRYRYRTIKGYKTLARGEVNMGLVLQKSFQGVVKLFSEKNPDPLAVVTVSSLTSTPTETDEAHPVDGASSEEDDEMIFSDELRGSDSDSIENLDPSNYEERTENVPKLSLKQPSSVLRLLRLRGPGRQRGVPVEVTLGLDEEGEGGGSPASSLSDSYDEEDETLSHGQATPRPRLRPFFGSDTLSLMSIPQPGEAEGVVEGVVRTTADSLEVISRDRSRSCSPSTETLRPLDMPESALIVGRLWLVQEADTTLQGTLQSLGEPLLATPTQCTSSSLLSLFNTLHTLWHKSEPFLLLVTGSCHLLSTILKAYVTGPTFSIWIYLWSDIEKQARASPLHESISLDDKKKRYSLESISQLLGNIEDPLVSRPLPIAQAELSIEATPSQKDPTTSRHIPFIFNVVTGPWDMDTTEFGKPSLSPTTAAAQNISHEHHELLLEYWNGKKESQKSSIKVRSLMITVISGPLLNITAIVRKKGIRIRKPKDSTGENSIISNTASYLLLRSTKNETITAFIDGVEWSGLLNIKLSARWSHTQSSLFPRATCSTPPNSAPLTQ